MEEKAKEIRSGQVSIEDGFWSRMQEKVIDVVIPFQEKAVSYTHLTLPTNSRV